MDIEKGQSFNVKIQWGKQKFNFDFDVTNDLETIKVPPKNQKLLFKGKMIKEDSQLKSLPITDGSIFMLMGAAEGKGMDIEKIEKKTFVENMTDAEKAKYYKDNLGTVLPFGLDNLGNTCYINSSVQVMLRIPELRDSIYENKNSEGIPRTSDLIKAMASLFTQLETSGDTVFPASFIQSFMGVFPQFAQAPKEGKGFEQQDADECFQGILSTLEPGLSKMTGSVVENIFDFKVRFTWKNMESEAEPENVTVESMRRLPCIIDNQAHPINLLSEGIEAGLAGDLEKHSETLDRSCLYSKIGKLATLPDYLVVQKIRFIWKAEGNNGNGSKAKILRAVTFPKTLDVDKFCTPELQETFKGVREKIKVDEEEKKKKVDEEYEKFKKQHEKDADLDTAKLNKKFKETRKEIDSAEEEASVWHDLSKGTPTGNYELVGVITHKGRSADSGHYLGWFRSKGEKWHKFDDELVTEVKIEDVLALRGGGDWHMAYYLVYRKIVTDL